MEQDELQLVDDEGEANITGPPSIWHQVGHGRWHKQEARTVAIVGVGDDADHGGPCTGKNSAPVVVMDGAGNGTGHGEPCTADGVALPVVLGARELGFDDPEGDPFEQLDE